MTKGNRRDLTQEGLSAETQAELDTLDAALSARVKHPQSVSRIVGFWASFVREVEGGYRAGLDEYIYDLSCGDHLSELSSQMSVPLLNCIRATLDPLDDRFLRATHPSATMSRYFRHGSGGGGIGSL